MIHPSLSIIAHAHLAPLTVPHAAQPLFALLAKLASFCSTTSASTAESSTSLGPSAQEQSLPLPVHQDPTNLETYAWPAQQSMLTALHAAQPLNALIAAQGSTLPTQPPALAALPTVVSAQMQVHAQLAAVGSFTMELNALTVQAQHQDS